MPEVPEQPRRPRPKKARPPASGAAERPARPGRDPAPAARGGRDATEPSAKGRTGGAAKPGATGKPGGAGKSGGAGKAGSAGGNATSGKSGKSGKSGGAAKSGASGGNGKSGGSGGAARPPGSGGGARGGRPRPALTSRAAILALVICVIALSLAYPLREYLAQRARIAELREEQARAQQNVEQLQERREQLQDPTFIERAARTRLHYQYPGERAYVVVSEADEQDEQETEGSGEPWFTRLWLSVLEADRPQEPGGDEPGGPTR
ncbi:septum formation initiator family protein [Streptomonospora sp. S1-112]|uniref:Septum formation initiator family protein n=1 Tax=Streptomonospora mangrovi TaxID=2883123 RepID=A0A9X3NNI0_9ACTN|nr:septum formation initiator family protein [Streptomonospora mangrovi]MDA0566215.1 septum formation initiator family protein [Streptomonospora mangrovi]